MTTYAEITATTVRSFAPNTPGARTLAEATPMMIDGKRVTAEVVGASTYTVWIGGLVVAQGELDGTEGNLNDFFVAEALVATASVETTAKQECTAYNCTCEQSERTYRFINRGVWYTGCKTAVLDHWLIRYNAVDKNLAFQQPGAARTLLKTAIFKLGQLGYKFDNPVQGF